MSSHRILHYGLRPAKNIERKMICETLQRLAHFDNLHRYRYIGFGSRYFSDFTLIHKTLGIDQMISIEKEAHNQKWFEFNKPYKCVQPIYNHSNSVLPELDWSTPSILWLDYDGKLDKSVFSDILSFCSRANAGSILIITINTDAKESTYSSMHNRLHQLIDDVGESRIPRGTEGKDLSKKDKPKVLRKIIDNEILEKMSIRNGVLPVEQKLHYQQLFNFVYEDGAQMLTVGGIIYLEEQKPLLDKCAFHDFSYVRTEEQSYTIKVPNLTFREIHYLNQHMPLASEPLESFIPDKEIAQYAQIYRYFPTFTEAEV